MNLVNFRQVAGRLALPLILGLAASQGMAEENREHWQKLGRDFVNQTKAMKRPGSTAKNIILFLGDGMGITTVTAARILDGQNKGMMGEENMLSFDKFPHVALSKTYETDQQTPDSAGTMSAIVTGVKTDAGIISLDQDIARGDTNWMTTQKERAQTILELAEQNGKATGVVSTTRITHATPAACFAHSAERNWENDGKLSDEAKASGYKDIARQLLEFPYGNGLEVVLGGGRREFRPNTAEDPETGKGGKRQDGRDLTQEWVSRGGGWKYVWNQAGLDSIDAGSTDHLLGLFEDTHMEYEFDRPNDTGGEPSLAGMTSKAIEILQKDQDGYFLMVEGGRIDHAHHANNAWRCLTDTLAFDAAVQAALDSVDLANTLIIVTADHGHVFALGGYATRGNPILGKVVRNDSHGNVDQDFHFAADELPYTAVVYGNGPGYPGYDGATDYSLDNDGSVYGRGSAFRGDIMANPEANHDYLQESAVPMSSETHSGEDMPVYAVGAASHLVHGVMEQNVLYHIMKSAFGF